MKYRIKCLNCGNVVTPVELEKDYNTINSDPIKYTLKEYYCPICKIGREFEVIVVKEK